MLGIIGAMPEEVEFLTTNIENLKVVKYHNLVFYEGKISDKNVVVMQSGIGKVNAAMATTVLLEKYDIKYVFNIGTAGGVVRDANVLDIVLSEKVCYHDVDVTAFNYEFGQVPKCPLYFNSDEKLINLAEKILFKENIPYHKGLVASGDAFINTKSQIENIKQHFKDVIAVEMEASAISQICYLYKKPFIVIRSLSDIAGKKSNITFETFLKKSAEISGKLVLEMINNM